jgi:hypothetical protein
LEVQAHTLDEETCEGISLDEFEKIVVTEICNNRKILF